MQRFTCRSVSNHFHQFHMTKKKPFEHLWPRLHWNTPIKLVLLLYFDNTWVFSNTVQKIFTVSIFMSHWEHQDGWVWSQSALVAPSLSTTVIMFQKQKLSSNNGMLTYWHTALMFETEPRDWGTNSLRWDIVSAHSICWKEHPFQGRNAKYSIVLQCYWNDT